MQGGPSNQEEATEGEEGAEEYIRSRKRKAGSGDETLVGEATPRNTGLKLVEQQPATRPRTI